MNCSGDRYSVMQILEEKWKMWTFRITWYCITDKEKENSSKEWNAVLFENILIAPCYCQVLLEHSFELKRKPHEFNFFRLISLPQLRKPKWNSHLNQIFQKSLIKSWRFRIPFFFSFPLCGLQASFFCNINNK